MVALVTVFVFLSILMLYMKLSTSLLCFFKNDSLVLQCGFSSNTGTTVINGLRLDLYLKKPRYCPQIARRSSKCILFGRCNFKSPSVGGQDSATLPACLSAGVFARTRMTFEITQLWRQITGSSLQGPQLSSLRQMFTFEPMTSQSALLFLSSLTTGAVKRAHTCFGMS